MAESLINDLAQLGDRQKCFVIALFAGIYKDGDSFLNSLSSDCE